MRGTATAAQALDLGDGLYGVEAAAQGYFGKEIARVTPAEAALLVALVLTLLSWLVSAVLGVRTFRAG